MFFKRKPEPVPRIIRCFTCKACEQKFLEEPWDDTEFEREFCLACDRHKHQLICAVQLVRREKYFQENPPC